MLFIIGINSSILQVGYTQLLVTLGLIFSFFIFMRARSIMLAIYDSLVEDSIEKIEIDHSGSIKEAEYKSIQTP